jgi:hypothetical protein
MCELCGRSELLRRVGVSIVLKHSQCASIRCDVFVFDEDVKVLTTEDTEDHEGNRRSVCAAKEAASLFGLQQPLRLVRDEQRSLGFGVRL